MDRQVRRLIQEAGKKWGGLVRQDLEREKPRKLAKMVVEMKSHIGLLNALLHSHAQHIEELLENLDQLDRELDEANHARRQWASASTHLGDALQDILGTAREAIQ